MKYCPKCKKFIIFGRPDFEALKSKGVNPKDVISLSLVPEKERNKCPICGTKLEEK